MWHLVLLPATVLLQVRSNMLGSLHGDNLQKNLIRTYLNHSTMNIRRLFLSPAEAKKHKRQIVNRGKWLIKPKVWKFLQKCGSLKRSTRFSSCV